MPVDQINMKSSYCENICLPFPSLIMISGSLYPLVPAFAQLKWVQKCFKISDYNIQILIICHAEKCAMYHFKGSFGNIPSSF